MIRSFGMLIAVSLFSVAVTGPALGDDKDPTPILDKAIKALGGEEKLAKAPVHLVKSEGTITINDNETPIKLATITQGLDRQKVDFELEFNGESFKGMAVVNGSKGWRKFGDNVMDLDDDGLAGAKQGIYLAAAATSVLPLKGKGFKVEVAPDEKVAGKPADVLKVTAPDGKTFTLAFDKETSLPVKVVARVPGMQGDVFEQETIYSDFKEFDGIKRATKAESKRDGNTFSKLKITEVKLIEKPEASLFDEPK